MTEYFTINSRDLSSIDTDSDTLSSEETWAIAIASLCEEAIETGIVKTPPIIILDNKLVMPVDPRSITYDGAFYLFGALVDGWKSAHGIEVIIDGHKRTLKYGACKKREVEEPPSVDSTSEDPVTYLADELKIRALEEAPWNAFMAAFLGLLPISASITYPSRQAFVKGKELKRLALETADAVIAERDRDS
jgi:hypothetical protein